MNIFSEWFLGVNPKWSWLWLLCPFLMYFFAMFLFPQIQCSFCWDCVQRTWERWQTLNTGMLAFCATIIVLLISRYEAEEIRKREFRASKVFLSDALSELTQYCKLSFDFYDAAWTKIKNRSENTPFEDLPPIQPSEHKIVFEKLIRFGDIGFGCELSQIASSLQIHKSRARALVNELAPDSKVYLSEQDIFSEIYHISGIQARVNNLYAFARDEEEYKKFEPTWDQFQTVFLAADVGLQNYAFESVAKEGEEKARRDLESYIRSKLEKPQASSH